MDAHYFTIDEEKRHANDVMTSKRVGAMHQTRLSFSRILIRKMTQKNWQITLKEWQLCPLGYGHVIYQLKTPNHIYNFVVFCQYIDDCDRNDRVIAEKWDVTFVLVSGVLNSEALNTLRDNVPLQESGRTSNKVLVLARANRSVRVFESIVSSLSAGHQPSVKELVEVGYILRTTAVYGNGKFGIADFDLLEENEDFNQSFLAQMCAVYMLRHFSIDWIHYIAKQRGGNKAVYLEKKLQRYIGIGNATGLGMALFLVHHPCIVDQWMSIRENAFNEILSCSIDSLSSIKFMNLLEKAIQHFKEIITTDVNQKYLNQQVINELEKIISNFSKQGYFWCSWRDFFNDLKMVSYETQEVATSCLMELYPEKIDHYQNDMNADESLSLKKGLIVSDLLQLLTDRYQWAIGVDFNDSESQYWFWYRSEDKAEPRLGVRGVDLGEDKELPLDIARQISKFYSALKQTDRSTTLAEFLLEYPEYRYIARRVWVLGNKLLGEIQINSLDKYSLPMSFLRCKLSILGATKFDPRSDRWVRVTFFQGAPLYQELNEEEWIFPVLSAKEKMDEKL